MKLPINQIIQGDCLEVMKDWPDNCVDLVLTDPPYKTEFIPLFGRMAEVSEKLLKNGSLLVTLAGHFALNKIIPDMDKYLDYYWIGGMPNKGGSVARNFSRQVMCAWKPVLWFSKGKALDHLFVFDFFASKRIERQNHQWEQSLGWFEYYVEKLTKPDDLILDPFCGSGTTCVAAKMLGRDYIGIDISEEYCEIARERIKAVETGVPVKERRKGQIGLFK